MAYKDAKESSSTLSAIIVGLAIAIIPAALGYIASFYVDGIHKDRLAFTNEQIEKLYGPLHALAQANDATWKQFVASGLAPKNWKKLTKEEVLVWRAWMQNVLQPMNVKIENTIVDHSQLVVGDKLPGIFQNIIAHTEAYKALISTWKPEDIADINTYTSKSRNTVFLDFPNNLDSCVGDRIGANESKLQHDRRLL